MSKHYKKLILLLIPACAGFCLALALGSAEEDPVVCNECIVRIYLEEWGRDYYSDRGPMNPYDWGPVEVIDFLSGPCESCRLEDNKALVKDAILAFDEDPYDANLPEQYDPNYVQHSPNTPYGPGFDYRPTGPLMPESFFDKPFTFEHIIAQGDMVAVRVSWDYYNSSVTWLYPSQFATYRIANGKIVEAWISDCSQYFKP